MLKSFSVTKGFYDFIISVDESFAVVHAFFNSGAHVIYNLVTEIIQQQTSLVKILSYEINMLVT
ncbi:MAG: hypothetical protein WDO15_13975 [Bacteroidota bacterium]